MKHKRLQRCLALAEMIRTGRAEEPTELGKSLHVSRRTVFRDLRLLCEAGYRVIYDPGIRGYRMQCEIDVTN